MSRETEEKKKRKKTGKILLIIFAVLIIGFWLIPVEEEEDELQTTTPGIGMEEKEYKGDAGGSSKWTADIDSQNMTVMVYLMGSDLESQGGCASVDIDEMLEAEQWEDLATKRKAVIHTNHCLAYSVLSYSV